MRISPCSNSSCISRPPERHVRFAEPLTNLKRCSVLSVDSLSIKQCVRTVVLNWIPMQTTARFVIITSKKMSVPSAVPVCQVTRLIASPQGGLVCPTCHSLNEFAFCKKCGTALTEEARMLVKELQLNPDYQELVEIVQEYSKLENALPYNSERDIVREQANIKLRERVLALLAKDEGVENPVIPKPESKRMTKEELEEQKAAKIKMLSAILDKLAVPVSASPAKARNYAMASKPVGVRLAWVCNYKHAMHSSPCGCAKPQLGGKWVVLGKNSTDEIKDDK